MKKIVLIMALLPFVLSSCGGGNNNNDTENDENGEEVVMEDFSGMNEFSLKPFGLKASLMLPEVASSTGNSIDPSVAHEEGDYLWYINIGPRFQLIIEDFGKEDGKVEDEKNRLADLENIFNIEYTVNEPHLIMYKRTLHEGQGGKKTYHCYGEAQIDGYNYVLRSPDEGALKPIIEDMVKTIRSTKESK